MNTALMDAAEARLPAIRQKSSHGLGWSSVLARSYLETPNAAEFTTAPTDNLLMVMVTGGMYTIESHEDGRWQSTVYRAGSIGLTAPGSESLLRWRAIGTAPLTSLHLYLSPALFTEHGARSLDSLPDALAVDDPVMSAVGSALGWALQTEASSLYADTAAQFLAVHLMERHRRGNTVPSGRGLSASALHQVVTYLHENLAENVTLEQLAKVARLSKHHFLRSFKTSTGATPHGFLTALRMQRAAELLGAQSRTVSSIAAQCGYRSASHFASAFYRHHGCSPAAYREDRYGANRSSRPILA